MGGVVQKELGDDEAEKAIKVNRRRKNLERKRIRKIKFAHDQGGQAKNDTKKRTKSKHKVAADVYSQHYCAW